MKRCNKCGRRKPESEFYSHATTSDRLRGDCKACHIAYVVGRQKADPEGHARKMHEYRRRWQRGVRTLNRSAVTIISTESQLMSAMDQPRPFYHEGLGLVDGGGWL